VSPSRRKFSGAPARDCRISPPIFEAHDKVGREIKVSFSQIMHGPPRGQPGLGGGCQGYRCFPVRPQNPKDEHFVLFRKKKKKTPSWQSRTAGPQSRSYVGTAYGLDPFSQSLSSSQLSVFQRASPSRYAPDERRFDEAKERIPFEGAGGGVYSAGKAGVCFFYFGGVLCLLRREVICPARRGVSAVASHIGLRNSVCGGITGGRRSLLGVRSTGHVPRFCAHPVIAGFTKGCLSPRIGVSLVSVRRSKQTTFY